MRWADGQTGTYIDSVARIIKPWTAEELAWRDLIRQRAGQWAEEIPALAILFDPVSPPARGTIVLDKPGRGRCLHPRLRHHRLRPRRAHGGPVHGPVDQKWGLLGVGGGRYCREATTMKSAARWDMSAVEEIVL